MAKYSPSFHQFSLPLTSQEPRIHQNQNSYSRCLSKTNQSQPSLSQSSLSSSGKQSIKATTLLNRSFFAEKSIKKDEMLKVLKTQNYLLAYQNDQSFKKPEIINSKICRDSNKQFEKTNNQNKLPRDSKIKHRRIIDKQYAMRTQQREQNVKKFLVKNLRVEKWLSTINVRLA